MNAERIGADRWLISGDGRLLDWCAARIPSVGVADGWRREGAQALGLVIGGKIASVMVVHDYNPRFRNAQISLAADDPRWATRASIAALLRYPFGQLGCERVTTLIPAKNIRAIRFNLGIGFAQEGRCEAGFGDDDALVFGLLRSRAPAWLGLRKVADSAIGRE